MDKLSESYKNMIMKTKTKIFGENDEKIEEIESNKNEIEGRYCESSRGPIYQNLVKYLESIEYKEEIIEKYRELCKESREIHNENYIYRERERGNIPKWNELERKREEYKEKIKGVKDWERYIIACLYTYQAPLRTQDYLNCYFKKETEEDTKNYIDLDKGIIVLNRYKTKKVYGRKEIEINKELMEILREYKRVIGRDELLKVRRNEVMSRKIKEIFGVNCDTIRGIYASEVTSKMDKKERKKKAKEMCHSITTHIVIYDNIKDE